jgi:uncharacterized membrane protein SpoIIM required for sporulation
VDLERFIRLRRQRWARLESLLDRAEQTTALGTDALQELLSLYRQACSDLNEARSYTANAELLGRLNDLTGRGYRYVYRGAASTRIKGMVRRFLAHDVPLTFRREKGFVLAAAAALLAGVAFGLSAVAVDRNHGHLLIPGEFFTESPKERVAKIEKGEERIDTLEKALSFGASLYTHNIQVSFAAFALGALTIGGGLLLLFYNGVILGAVAGMYFLDGVTTFFLAWVGPHGALEIPAIVFGGAAGLRAGRALIAPGERSQAAALREAFPSVWRMMLATALVLVLAGLIEGSFSQFSSRTFPYPLKIAVAALLLVTLLSWLFVRRLPQDAEGVRP